MVGVTAVIALEAEMVAGALTRTAATLGLSPAFLGAIVLALVGTSADLFAASWFAYRDKIGLALNICVGSAIPMAFVVTPLLVLISAFMDRPMNLVFHNPLYLFTIASTAFVVNAVARDGETTWFEGLLLVGVYVLFGLSFSSLAQPDGLHGRTRNAGHRSQPSPHARNHHRCSGRPRHSARSIQ